MMVSNAKNENLNQLAESVKNADDMEVVGHVDIANKSVQDVLVVKGSFKKDDDKQCDDLDDKVIKDAQEKFDEVKDEVKKTVHDKVEAAKDKVEEAKLDTQQKVADIKEEVVDQAQELKEDAQEKVAELKEKGEDAVDEVKQKAEQALQDAKDKAQIIKGDIQDKAEELKDKTGDALDVAKDKAFELKQQVQDAIDNAKEVAHDVIGDVKDKFDHVKADAQEQTETLKVDAQEKVGELKNKAEQLTEEVKDKVEQLTQIAKDKAESLSGDVERIKFDDALQSNSGILAKIGTYFAGMNDAKQTHFSSVDLNNEDFGEDAFRAQVATIGSQLFGGKLATAQSLVSKVAPNANAQSISQVVFDKVANWANKWAEKDLSKDARFDKLTTLSEAERDEFARDVANQNRALAVMGGLSGLFGIKGVIADTAWLLMVSLKSVYQLALIYDKPLLGADGVKLAYGVLSGANLSKLQEKQVLLTALALGNAFFINAQDSSLKQELEKVGLKYRTGDTFAKQLDDLSNFIDIDKLNTSWFKRILPVTSVGVGVYYNHELIEEVLGTAMATFRPENPKLLNDHTEQSPNA